MASGILYLRPSADISVGHILYPAGSTAAYLLINEEVSDNNATYIRSDTGEFSAPVTSKFVLSNSNQPSAKKYIVTAVILNIDPYCSSTDAGTAYNELDLEIDGVSMGFKHSSEPSKETVIYFDDAIAAINEFLAVNGTLPPINLTVISHGGANTDTTKNTNISIGITQAYLAVYYDEITDIGIHHKVNGTWLGATAAYQKQSGAWTEITAEEAKTILQNSFCTK